MASGDPVVQKHVVMIPKTLAAGANWREGASSPVERLPIFLFDQTTTEYMDFLCFLEGYGGNGLTLRLAWMAPTLTTNNVRWGAAIRRFQDDVDKLDVSHTYAFNDVAADDPAPSAAGELGYVNITFADGADMDSWANGEFAIIRIRRTPATSNLAEDAQLVNWSGKET